MRMQKRQFRIGELAKHLNVKKFVIRFWEKEFALRATRSDGGQRFYNEDDIHSFCIIKSFLYEQGFTIAGARKHLQEASLSAASLRLPEISVATKALSDRPTWQRDSHRTTLESSATSDLKLQLDELKKQLVALRELL